MNQVKYGVILSYILMGINSFAGLFYTPFLLRKLGQTEFGLYSLAASVIAYLLLLDLGFHGSIVRFVAKFRAENKTRKLYEMLGMFFVIYCVLALIIAIIGVGVVCNTEKLLNVEHMTSDQIFRVKVIVCILIGNLCFSFPLSIFSAVVVAYERFVFSKSIHILRVLLQIAVMILLLIWGYKAVALAVLITFFNILTLFANMFYALLKLKTKILFTRFDFSLLKEISVFSLFVFLNCIMDNIFWSSGQFILGYTSGLEAIAVYAIAIRLTTFYMGLSSGISGVLLPKITGMVTNGCSEEAISSLFIKAGRLQFYIVGTLLAGFIVFGQWFVDFWAGEGYCQAYWVCVILMITLLIPLIQNTGIEILKARNQLGFRSTVYLCFAVFGLFISYFCAKKYGVVGCAVGTAFALFLGQGIVINLYYWKRIKINIPEFWLQMIKLLSPITVISAVFLLLFKFIGKVSVIGNVCGVMVFAAAVAGGYWLFSMNSFEKDLLLSLFKKVFRKMS